MTRQGAQEADYDPEYEVATLFIEARYSKGWTQAKLAKKMGTKQPSIARWETGSKVPSVKVLIRLAKIQNKKITIKIL